MRLSGSLAGAAIGALAGAAALILASALSPTLHLDLNVAPLVRGAYPTEYGGGDEFFSWTGREVTVDLPGLDRRVTWSCAVRLEGARADPATLPQVSVAVDGVTRATLPTTNTYQTLQFNIPERPASPGVVLSLVSSNTFEPGPSDRRALGVRVEHWSCVPAGFARPPTPALWATAGSAAMLGAGLGLIGYPPALLALGVGLLAGGQSAVFTRGLAAFAPYASQVPWLAFWLATGLVVAARLMERRAGQPLRRVARFVLAFSVGALFLKLLALLHPSKAVGDALFHAHRLESVLGGRYYFTQPLANGLEFPYAIGLYMIAAPWSALTHDHVMLLRVVVALVESAAGVLLYVMIVRNWGDRLAGAIAVVLFSLVPLSYSIFGTGMLTNAFGRSVALAAVAVATIWPLQPRFLRQALGLTLLSSLAMLSHVSTFALLLVTLVAVALLFRWRGDEDARASARTILVATVAAAVFSIAAYYGHFGSAYMKALNARSERAASAVSATVQPGRAAAQPTGTSGRDSGFPTLIMRVTDALTLTSTAMGWPLLVLAVVGSWRAWKDGARDRLLLVIVAWGASYFAFLVVGIAAPVDAPNQRYAAEFVGRVAYAACPALVLLAARGGAWAWRQGAVLRIASAAVGLGAVHLGVRSWFDWVR